MSTVSPQSAAAGENAAWQAQLSGMLSSVALPELQMLLGGRLRPGGENKVGTIQQMLQGRDLTGRLPGDAAVLRDATAQLNAGYEQAGMGQREALGYAGLRSGEGRRSPGALTGAWQGMATGLERDRMQALNNLNFMSAQQSMTDYNKLLALMGQGVQTGLGLAQGFSGASNAAIGGLSNQSQFGGAMGGALSGAGLGFTVGGWPGAIIGGVGGGVAGYLGSG